MYRRRLPHWRSLGATYFVTWRLHTGQRDLIDQERDLVVAAMRRFDRTRYDLLAFVVMNDHVHAVVTPLGRYRLQDIVHSWKSFTANRLQRSSDRAAQVWQHESFDRVIRDDAELIEKTEYVLGNPQKRWPNIGAYPWVGCRDQ